MWSEERAGRVSAFKDESTEVQVGSRRTTEKISKAKNSFPEKVNDADSPLAAKRGLQ